MKIIKNRRDFIKSIGKGVLGSALGGSLLPLLANAQNNSDYKALVCINLQGGNDAFNCVVPTGDSAYSSYQNIRQELAVPREQLLTLNQSSHGFNPCLYNMQSLFNQGKLATLANAGNLLEPIDKQSYFDKSALAPAHLFSHHDQTLYADTLNNGELSSGWAGRIAEMMGEYNINQQLSMNISISGDNYWQRGSVSLPDTLTSDGVNIIKQLSETDPAAFSASRAKIYRHFLNAERDHLLQKHYSNVQMKAWTTSQYISDVLASQTTPDLPIDALKTEGNFIKGLGVIARLIAARDAFQVKRQIFYINLNGFDTHRDQIKLHGPLLSELDHGLGLFYQSLVALGMENQVTTFTTSEFGRTLTRNGDGSDHGWGGHQWIMGGAVKGQTIYGELPAMELDSDQDIGRGRMIPQISFDEYASTLGKWFGLSYDDLKLILPRLQGFNSPDLGFMK